jgi:hypothetical protein
LLLSPESMKDSGKARKPSGDLLMTKESVEAAAKAGVVEFLASAAGVESLASIRREVHRWPLPSPASLASIAAVISKGNSLLPSAAVDYAFDLYRESCARLERAMDEQQARDSAGKAAAVPLPTSFPARLDDFLRLIVKGKTPADSACRFREFLRHRAKRDYSPHDEKTRTHQSDSEWEEDLAHSRREAALHQERLARLGKEGIEKRIDDEACGALKKFRRKGFKSADSWISLAQDFLGWWKRQRSEKARASAKTKTKGIAKTGVEGQ